jgi:hypothetical protein
MGEISVPFSFLKKIKKKVLHKRISFLNLQTQIRGKQSSFIIAIITNTPM